MFISVGVSGMNSDLLSRGRPYGGCSIPYRKSLSSCISPVYSCSDRFCGVRLSDSSGLSYLLVCVYMPTYYDSDSCCLYLNTLGELEGFIASHSCDVNIIVGDFNVDFDRGGPLLKLLDDFMLDFDLSACDLNFCPSVGYTYESDDSVSRSWIDHILCSQHMSSCIILFILSQHPRITFHCFFKLISPALTCHPPRQSQLLHSVFILIGLKFLQLMLKNIITQSHVPSVNYLLMCLFV